MSFLFGGGSPAPAPAPATSGTTTTFTREAPELVSTERDDNGSWKAVSYNVGNGSEVNVKYKEWTSERNGETYKGLDLQKVQVVSLVAYGDDEDFEDNEDF